MQGYNERPLRAKTEIPAKTAILQEESMHTTARSLLLLLTLTVALAALPAVAQVVIGTVTVGAQPASAGANSVTNKIYVANNCGNDPTCMSGNGTVTVIDGATLATQTVGVGDYPYGVAVNTVTNKIYVATCGSDPTCSSNGTVTVIDGATLSFPQDHATWAFPRHPEPGTHGRRTNLRSGITYRRSY
jgi:YVTN family beta-propeller protein